MDNLPPNINVSNPQLNSLGHTIVSQYNQMPLINAGVKQDANSNNPSQVGYTNVSDDSGNNSPAFNRPPLPTQGRSQMNSVPLSVPNQYGNQIGPPQMNTSSLNYGPQHQYAQSPQYGQKNSNTPPLVPSSQAYFAHPSINGMPQMKPPSSSPHPVLPNVPNITPSVSHGLPRASPAPPNGPYVPSQPSSMNGPTSGTYIGPPTGLHGHPSSNSGPSSGFGTPHSFAPPKTGPSDKGPTALSGPPSNISGPQSGPPRSISGPTNGPPRPNAGLPPSSGFTPNTMASPNGISGPSVSASGVLGPPMGNVGPRGFPATNGSSSISGPPGPASGVLGPPRSNPGPPNNFPAPSVKSGPTSLPGPPTNVPGPQSNMPAPQGGFKQPPSNYSGPNSISGVSSGPVSFGGLPSGPTSYTQPGQPVHHNFSPYPGPPKPSYELPPHGAPVTNQAKGNMQNRYPSMPQQPVNLNHEVPPLDMARYPDNSQGLTQQMGGLSVTKQGFNQLWGHQMVDLLQNRHIIPAYVEDPPPIKLTQQFADSPNCSPEIFRCTLNRIPETNNLLQKSRLPLGVLIHPFKDLNHLPVIQCMSIVRCRACRTYINPFVYFVDSKRWKCNLCFRVNDLPDEFQYDPVTKSYGDPSRRPEIKSATIEYIAPSEYMLRPPQPAVYLFLLDVSQLARESGYLQIFCDTLKNNLDQLPGDLRTQVGFICYDAHIHYYLMSPDFNQPKEMTVIDIDDIFLPSPTSLLVNLHENRNLIVDLLTHLPKKYSHPGTPASALGAALQAAHKLMGPTGGRITVFQSCLPNIGPGALTSREDPNARSSKEVTHLTPATDFYKRIALDCSAAQVAVDLFLLNSQYSDLATLSGMSKFSGGTVYHIPLFNGSRSWQCTQLNRMFSRYLTRKIGFEAVMRVRCTRGITIHTFHGNFFVRSTDLLSLPNVSPDAGFGMQLSIEESLSDLQQVCFQAALLYTSSKGERRIRVHTMALPIASNLTDVLHHADQECIIGLLSKMAVDRCVSASMSEAREALMTVAVDALSAHRLAQNLPAGANSNALHAPYSLRLLPLYLLALLKRRAFRTGTSTRLDDRVADMCEMKTLPLQQLLRAVYPDLYPIHSLQDYLPQPDPDIEQEENVVANPPRLQLTAEKINMNGAYLLDDGELMVIYIGSNCTPAYLSETWGVAAHSQLPQESRTLPRINSPGNVLLHTFIDKLNDDRPYTTNLIIVKDTSPSRSSFTERLVDDRVESAFSYYEFLQHVKTQVK